MIAHWLDMLAIWWLQRRHDVDVLPERPWPRPDPRWPQS